MSIEIVTSWQVGYATIRLLRQLQHYLGNQNAYIRLQSLKILCHVYTTNVLFNLPVFGGSLSMISISVLALPAGMRTLPLLDNRLMSTRNISLSSLIVSSTMLMDACWDCCSPEDKTSGRFTTLWKSSPAVKRDRVQIRVTLIFSNNCKLNTENFCPDGNKMSSGHKSEKR